MFTSTRIAAWSRDRRNGQDHQPKSLVPGAAGVSGGGVLRHPAVDDGRELFDAGHLRQQSVLLEWRRLVQGIARSVDRSRRTISGVAVAQPVLLHGDPRHRGAARHRGGAGDAARWVVFPAIQLPKMNRVLLIAVLLRFMDSFMIYTEPFVVTGGGPGNSTTFVSIELVKIALGQFDLGKAAALSLVYNLIIIIVCWVFYTVMTNAGVERQPNKGVA